MTEEVWKDIEGYEGLYQISTLGRVRSFDRPVNRGKAGTIILKGRIISLNDNRGYKHAHLYKDGKRKRYLVNVLVAKAFIQNPNPDTHTQTNHKNENPSDNRVDNLEWCTPKYNCNYGNHRKNLYEGSRKRFRPVKAVNLTTGEELYFDSMSDAGRAGFTIQGIYLACRGKCKTFKGHTWEYADITGGETS